MRWFLKVTLKRTFARDGNPCCEKTFPKFNDNMFYCINKFTMTCCGATTEKYDLWRYLFAVQEKFDTLRI